MFHTRFISIVLASLFVFTSFLSCEDNSPTFYTLTTSVNPTEGGTVTPSEGEYEESETVSLIPIPNNGWIFDRWSGDFNGASNPLSMAMDSDKNIVANFIKRTYPLTITIEGEGTVTETIIQEKSRDYEHGTLVELTPVPSEGWEFVSWSGGVESLEEMIQIRVEEEVSITATFIKKIYPLTITIEGEGTVTETIIQEKSTEYEHGTLVELTPVPNEGWEFVNWSGDVESSDETIQVSVEEEVSITATFTKKIYPLNITLEGEGTVTEKIIQEKSTGYEEGTIIEVTPVPNNGWEFMSWGGDLGGNGIPARITMNGEKNITATFGFLGTIERTTYGYDANNNLIEYIDYNSDGSVKVKITYGYDSSNNLIEQVDYNTNGTVSSRITYSYDSNNNQTEQIIYYSDGSVMFRSTYRYDSNSNLIEEINYNPDGSVRTRITYRYDSSRNVTEEIHYASDGSVMFKTAYSYDGNSNLTKRSVYDFFDVLMSKTTFSYDLSNNMTEEIGYRADGAVNYRITFSYDANNNQIEYVSYRPNGAVLSRVGYEYDADNRMVKGFRLGSDGSLTWEQTYSYDSNDNMILLQTFMYPLNKFYGFELESELPSFFKVHPNFFAPNSHAQKGSIKMHTRELERR